MYATSEEARSDLFLAGAVYVLGPLVLRIVLGIVPLLQVPLLREALIVVLPLVTTALVPFLLVRYRKESWRAYGFGAGPSPLLGTGALIAAPIALATVLALLAEGFGAGAALPAMALGEGALIALLQRLTSWLGLVVLAVYGTVKARDAFRGEWQTVRDGMLQLGRYVGIALGAVTLLLLLGSLASPGPDRLLYLLLVPLGTAASFFIALRGVTGRHTTSRTTLLTPLVLFALGSFQFSLFDPARLVESLWFAAILGAIGLIVGALQETWRSAQGAVTMALVLALFSNIGIGRIAGG